MTIYMPEIFVGCSTESLAAAKAIQNNLQNVARVTIWTQDTFRLSRVTIHEIQTAAAKSDFAVFILAPDDLAVSRDKEQNAPRDNTIFETGFFMGTLGIEKVFVVKPRGLQIKLPTDLLGVTPALYEIPADGRWETAMGPASNKIEMEIRRSLQRNNNATTEVSYVGPHYVGPHHVYSSLESATTDIKNACYVAADIKVLSNRGFTFIGTDNSVLSVADLKNFERLRKLRVLLLSPNARWIARGLIETRGYSSVEAYVNEVIANHQIVEFGFERFATILTNTRSGVRHYDGEPYWRIAMTEDVAFVSSYADDASVQVRDLPVARFDNVPFSFYHVFKRYFNGVWHNHAIPSDRTSRRISSTASAGGVVYALDGGELYIALLKRSDGFWVLPKGHLEVSDQSLEAAALREVGEELGIDMTTMSVEGKLGVYNDDSFSQESEAKIVHIFCIRHTAIGLCTLNPDVDHDEARWWRAGDELPAMLYPQQREILREFLKERRAQA